MDGVNSDVRLPKGLSIGDAVTLQGYYEPHPNPRHVYTTDDILILWRVEATGLTRIAPPKRIPRTHKRLMEERAWWDEWHSQMGKSPLSPHAR